MEKLVTQRFKWLWYFLSISTEKLYPETIGSACTHTLKRKPFSGAQMPFHIARWGAVMSQTPHFPELHFAVRKAHYAHVIILLWAFHVKDKKRN